MKTFITIIITVVISITAGYFLFRDVTIEKIIEVPEPQQERGFCIRSNEAQPEYLFEQLNQEMLDDGYRLRTTRGDIIGCLGGGIYYKYIKNN